MKIGILETGEISDELFEKHGDYPDMFARLLHAINPDIEFSRVKVLHGELPDSPKDAEGWIITGSKHGVYEGHTWIEPLKEFIQKSVALNVPIAGICFGHQIIAEALGGKVEKSEKGWGLGVHDYTVNNRPSWMPELTETFSGHAIHQDQVIELPESATVIASSEFCPYASLVYGDPENPDALTIQPHPEFSAEFVDDLIELRMNTSFPEDRSLDARETIGLPVHNEDWAIWINRFLSLAVARNKE